MPVDVPIFQPMEPEFGIDQVVVPNVSARVLLLSDERPAVTLNPFVSNVPLVSVIVTLLPVPGALWNVHAPPTPSKIQTGRFLPPQVMLFPVVVDFHLIVAALFGAKVMPDTNVVAPAVPSPISR